MEGFLKEVTEKGFIRKTSALVPYGDLESVVEPDRVTEVLSPQLSGEEARGASCYAIRYDIVIGCHMGFESRD